MKVLKEETKYHHGSFKDLQTFLDKNGDPYTLIKSDPSQSKSKSKGKGNSQNNQNQSNSQNQSQNQSNSQNQSQNQQNNQQQNNQKVPPDPNASYVDVNTGSEYKWDPKKNQFVRVGKYRAK